ncbi:uncharacterized protein LOC128092918 [Culex pipiens pallens]|uniref:uncharacterized protein LOC128092918 n=1 Tax=Culex pipiens pallens TaxID=42434 RepID=UPI0022AB414E|nr:uncharacterized protein LOC128092918 [Culex pipiens pallens]
MANNVNNDIATAEVSAASRVFSRCVWRVFHGEIEACASGQARSGGQRSHNLVVVDSAAVQQWKRNEFLHPSSSSRRSQQQRPRRQLRRETVVGRRNRPRRVDCGRRTSFRPGQVGDNPRCLRGWQQAAQQQQQQARENELPAHPAAGGSQCGQFGGECERRVFC